jgi:DNA repair exonuclease SbcCD ATPase subunit
LSKSLSEREKEFKSLELEYCMKKEKFEALNQQEQLKLAQDELSEYQKSLAQLKIAYETTSMKLLQLEDQNSELKDDNIEMTQIIKDYESKVHEYENAHNVELTTHENVIKTVKTSNKQLKKIKTNLEQKVVELTRDCEKFSEECKSLLEKHANLKQKETNLKNDLKELTAQNKKYEEKIEFQNTVIDNNEASKTQLIEKYRKEIQELKEQYDQTINIQKDHLKMFKKRVEKEIERMNDKLKNKGLINEKRDRMADILKELTMKEATTKGIRSEIKTVKASNTKFKATIRELRLKKKELESIIESNPRTKRLYESKESCLNDIPTKDDDRCYITWKEHNELLELNAQLKIENCKHLNKVHEYEENLNHLKSSNAYLEEENERLNKRCDNLIASEIEAKDKLKDGHSVNNRKIKQLNEKIESILVGCKNCLTKWNDQDLLVSYKYIKTHRKLQK